MGETAWREPTPIITTGSFTVPHPPFTSQHVTARFAFRTPRVPKYGTSTNGASPRGASVRNGRPSRLGSAVLSPYVSVELDVLSVLKRAHTAADL